MWRSPPNGIPLATTLFVDEQAAGPYSIASIEGFELIVKDATGNQRGLIGCVQPMQEFAH